MGGKIGEFGDVGVFGEVGGYRRMDTPEVNDLNVTRTVLLEIMDLYSELNQTEFEIMWISPSEKLRLQIKFENLLRQINLDPEDPEVLIKLELMMHKVNLDA